MTKREVVLAVITVLVGGVTVFGVGYMVGQGSRDGHVGELQEKLAFCREAKDGLSTELAKCQPARVTTLPPSAADELARAHVDLTLGQSASIPGTEWTLYLRDVTYNEEGLLAQVVIRGRGRRETTAAVGAAEPVKVDELSIRALEISPSQAKLAIWY